MIYDFVSDSRRAKFAKILEKYGIRIQYSVFEFSLTKARKTELFAKMKQNDFLRNNRQESIMILPISNEFLRKIERYGDTTDIFDQAGIFLV